jgi:hypothetical protein
VRLRSIVRRRPSAPMAMSAVALFMSVGGVGYAAASLPANSVGAAQIRDNAVTYKKIEPNSVGVVRLARNGVSNSKIRDEAVSYKKIRPNAVGKVRANLKQLQARLASTCAAGTAVGAVDEAGKVTCNAALPARLGAAEQSVAVTGTATAVANLTLPAGAGYLAFANPSVTVTGANGSVTVSCTLALGSASQTRSVTVDASAGGTSATLSLRQAGAAGTAALSCVAPPTNGTTVQVASGIDALQTTG